MTDEDRAVAPAAPRRTARRATPSEPSPSATRRRFLAGTGLTLLSAAGGVVAGLLGTRHTPHHPVQPPALLLAAVAAERALIAELDASRIPLATRSQLRADHVAHLRALQAAVAQVSSSPSAVPPTAAVQSGVAPSAAKLRQLEQLASAGAATRALGLTGRDAVLLASIAACEASHVELLS